MTSPSHTQLILTEVRHERLRQETLWGQQDLPDGTSTEFACLADAARADTESHKAEGVMTYLDVLAEEFWEAMAEEDPDKLRAELIQVAAVAVKWAEAIDRRLA